MSVCQNCHTELSSTAPEGLCSVCLFRSLLDSNALSAEKDEPVLQILGDYHLLRELGRGGMGAVYEAHQVSLNRKVAVKLILPGPASDQVASARFRREAEAVGRLEHPNIVPIYEVGEHREQPFFSMKLVEGGRTLSGWAGNQSAAACLMLAISRAVHYAHQRGILHRDLKPSNILLDAEQIPYLTDFGLAKIVAEPEWSLTQPAEVMGTLHYMPPEQATGKASEATIAADVYGLGAIFYELLTGRSLFPGEGLEVLRKVVEAEPEPPTSTSPIDRDLETICLKCLEKHPDRRYGSAEDVAQELERWTNQEPILARPVNLATKSWKWARRHPAKATSLGLTATFLIIAAFGITLFSFNLNRRAKEATRQLIRSHETLADRLEDSGDTFGALGQLAQALRLEETQLHSDGTRLRLRLGVLLSRVPTLEGLWIHDAAIESLRFSPDGTQFAACGADGRVHLREVGNGQSVGSPLEHPGPVRDALFDASGRFLATVCQIDGEPDEMTMAAPAHAQVWDLQEGTMITDRLPATIHRYKTPLRPPIALSGDGTKLVVCHLKGATLWDLNGGKQRAHELPQGGWGRCASFSPNDRWIVTGSATDGARLWDARTGTLRHHLAAGQPVNGTAFQNNGQRLALLAGTATILVYPLDPITGDLVGEALRLRDPLGSDLVQFAFERDGPRLAATSFAHLINMWDTRTGESLQQGMTHARVFLTDFNRDGRLLLSTSLDGSVRLWDTGTGEPKPPLLTHQGSIFTAAFSPTENRLLTASQDGVIRHWAFAQRSTIDQPRQLDLPENSGGLRFCERSPDGRHLLVGMEEGEAILWNTQNWDSVRLGSNDAHGWLSGAFLPDGSGFALTKKRAGTGPGVTILLHSTDGVASAEAPIRLEQEATLVRFGPLGEWFVGVGNGGPGGSVGIWDRAGQSILPPFSQPSAILDAAIAPSREILATVSAAGLIRVFAIPSGQEISSALQLTGRSRLLQWHPTEDRLLSANNSLFSYAGEAAQLLLPREDIRHELFHTDGVLASAFDPEGRVIATSGQDLYIRWWDAESGKPTNTPPVRIDDTVPDVLAFSTDGRLLAAGGRFGKAFVWDAHSGQRIGQIQAPAQITHLFFGADSQQVIAACALPPSVSVFSLAAMSKSLEELVHETELLSGQRFDAQRGLLPLSREELKKLWNGRPNRASNSVTQ